MGSMPKNQEGVSDRISALSSEVLCHILSILPTNYAVRTTMLSKRWKNIWTSVPNLYFCDDDYPEFNDFTAFVNRVLDSHDLSRIQKFHLHCEDDYFEPPVDRWIHAAMERKFVELDLCVDLPYEEQPSGESADVEDIHQYAEQHDCAIAIVKDICDVKYLFLSAHNLEGDLPAFDNLNQLKLVLFYCDYWRFLTKLLQRSPNLEHLIFEHKVQCSYSYSTPIPAGGLISGIFVDCYKEFVNCSECNEEDFEHVFYPPEIVPISLSLHLKTITVNRYKGTRYEVQLVKYLLKNGEVLNKMTISTEVTSDEQPLFEEFLLFQRGSKTCEVEMQF